MLKYFCDQCGHEFKKTDGIVNGTGTCHIGLLKGVKGGWNAAEFKIKNTEKAKKEICFTCIAKYMYAEMQMRAREKKGVERELLLTNKQLNETLDFDV